MQQLSLFTQPQLAEMRDRTVRRNYSPEHDAFRREHQRRRDHGKAQRHASRIYRAFPATCDDRVPQIPPQPKAPKTRRQPPAPA